MPPRAHRRLATTLAKRRGRVLLLGLLTKECAGCRPICMQPACERNTAVGEPLAIRSDTADVHAFVVRMRMDPPPGEPSVAVPRIRLEYVNEHRVWHFDNIDEVLARLGSCLGDIVRNAMN